MNDIEKISANELVPGDIFHPGEYLKEEILERGISQNKLADLLEVSKSMVSSIIHGRRNITPSLAVKIEHSLGISAEFWMNLQIKYDIDLIKKKYNDGLKKSSLSPSKKKRMKELIKAA